MYLGYQIQEERRVASEIGGRQNEAHTGCLMDCQCLPISFFSSSSSSFQDLSCTSKYCTGNRPSSNSFFRKLDRDEKAYGRSGPGSMFSSGNRSSLLDGLDESFDTLSDGIDGKLKEEARYFEFDPDEVEKDDYAYRADMTFRPGNIYGIMV
ncbi:uncharacterized protein LOC129884234 [Solanum dulcamara]|uniref:uncharacterized protein LOC129884234 n=1 Tax=Solanum dulcamara TaxID=45834 RepID=UPI002485FC3F|nr:uncharacterized protein LOC129884234 [Solanum dulcamara]